MYWGADARLGHRGRVDVQLHLGRTSGEHVRFEIRRNLEDEHEATRVHPRVDLIG